MIYIGICDNEERQVAMLREIVEIYFLEKKLEFEIVCATNSEKLLEKGDSYDIILLDIDMDKNDINGVEIGKEIRKVNKSAYLIYITGYPQYMMSAQSNHFFYYLLKPYKEEAVMKIFDEVLEYLSTHRVKIVFRTDRGVIKVSPSVINYFEFHKREATMKTTSRKYLLEMEEEEILEKIKEYNFATIHVSFLVNIENIRRVKEKEIWMINGDVLPVATRRAKEIKEKFTEWLFSQA